MRRTIKAAPIRSDYDLVINTKWEEEEEEKGGSYRDNEGAPIVTTTPLP